MSKKKATTILIFFIPALFIVFGITVVCPAHEYKQQSTYKATSVDECINEKECVWHAFSKQVGLADYGHWVVMGKSLHKWQKKMLFMAVGEAQNFLPQLTHEAIRELDIFFPYEIESERPPRYLMVFSDDVTKSLEEWKQKFSQRIVDEARSRMKYNSINNIEDGCYSISISNVGTKDISTVLTIVDTNNENAKYCMATHFYAAFGFWGYLDSQPFSFLACSSYEKIQFTKLDKFLLYLLYRPEFKSGQNLQQIKSIFDLIYSDSKENYLSMLKGGTHD
ncbi:MAG: hypothetical protein KAJ40_00145 [Alphaproteobacteria bacterium]|nr:hypothetical protein [Alphaproteobacteria bacterium]